MSEPTTPFPVTPSDPAPLPPPVDPAPAGPPRTSPGSAYPDPGPQQVAAPAPSGPYAPLVVAGLIGLLVAAWVLLAHTTTLAIDPGAAAPWVMLGLGTVLVVIGALALVGRGRLG